MYKKIPKLTLICTENQSTIRLYDNFLKYENCPNGNIMSSITRFNKPNFLLPFRGYPFFKAVSNNPEKKAYAYFCKTNDFGFYLLMSIAPIVSIMYFYLQNRDYPSDFYYNGLMLTSIIGPAMLLIPVFLKILYYLLRPSATFIREYINRVTETQKQYLFEERNLKRERILGTGSSNSEMPLSGYRSTYERGYSSHQEIRVVIYKQSELIVIKRVFSLVGSDFWEGVDRISLSFLVSVSEEGDKFYLRFGSGDEIYLNKKDTDISLLNSLRK